MNDALTQIIVALTGALVGVIALAALWARQKIAAATAAAKAETLEAETRVLKAESAKREAERLNNALVSKIEADTKPLTEADAKKTKSEFRAIAESFGAGDALKKTVETLGLSSSSRAEIAVPKEVA